MKKIYLSYLFFFFLIAPKAQVTNYGATITVNLGGLLYINGDYIHNNGTIVNNGTITINGNWENKAQANNYVFEEGSKGLVEFTGGKQKISGQEKTIFPKLAFLKNGGEIELGQDVEVRLSLNLGSSQVFTNSYKLTLRNPDLKSLKLENGKIEGVINTNGGGAFVRKTNERSPYLFPVGKKPDAIYPVTLAPVDDKFNFYEVSMINENPNDTHSVKSPDINFINDKYYYQITDLNGNSLENITFYTKPLEDFNWVISLESNKWEKWPHFEKNKGYSLYDGFNNSFKLSRFDLPVKQKLFTLAKATDNINLEIYNAFSPNGDGKNDTWDIKNIDLYPDNDVKIYDRSGNLVYKYSGYTSAKGWDGQNSPSGSYYYILRVKIGGEDKYYKGSVTLVKN